MANTEFMQVQTMLTRLIAISPSIVRDTIWAARDTVKPLVGIFSTLPDFMNGAIALARASRTIIHIACRGKEHYADGFLASAAWIVLSKIFRWIKLLFRIWFLALAILFLIIVLA